MSEAKSAVFLTGATGFIGGNVLRALLAEAATATETERPFRGVRALVRTEASAARVRALGAEPILGDLLQPTPDLLGAIAEARYLVHCAQPATRPESYAAARPELDRTLLAAVDPARVARLVYVCGSSFLGCGEGGALLDETSTAKPFGVSPTFAEAIAALRAARGRLDAAVAFVGGVYGRGSWFLEEYLAAIARGEPIVVRDPAPLWPYIHIDDCARAIVHLLGVSSAALDAVGREIIVADDEPAPMDAFVEAVSRASGKEPALLRLGDEAIRARIPRIHSRYLAANMPHSNARLRRLGFACRYPTIREGVAALDLDPARAR